MFGVYHTAIFSSSKSIQFRAKEQRLYIVYGRETARLNVRTQKIFIVYGRETTRMNIRSQRLYVALDFSSVTDYRYWRVYFLGPQNIGTFRFAEIEMRESLGGSDITSTSFAIYGNGSSLDAQRSFDDDTATIYSESSETSGNWVGQDFGAGNEKNIVEFTVTASNSSGQGSHCPLVFDLQASLDGVAWETKISVNDTLTGNFSDGETRTYN